MKPRAKNEVVEAKRAKIARTTISLPEDIFDAGKAKAMEDRRDFSNYVLRLIEADLKAVTV